MSKAFKCDCCLELFEGVPEAVVENMYEICSNCVRVAKIFNKVDPFHSSFHNKPNSDMNVFIKDNTVFIPPK